MEKPLEKQKTKSFSIKLYDKVVKFEASTEFINKVKDAYRFLKRNPTKRRIFLSIINSELKGKPFFKWSPPMAMAHNYQPYYADHINKLIWKELITEIKERNPETNRLSIALKPTLLGYFTYFYIYRYNRKLLGGLEFEA